MYIVNVTLTEDTSSPNCSISFRINSANVMSSGITLSYSPGKVRILGAAKKVVVVILIVILQVKILLYTYLMMIEKSCCELATYLSKSQIGLVRVEKSADSLLFGFGYLSNHLRH